MTVSLSEASIVSSKSSLRLISSLLRDGVTCRLLELGGEMGTEGSEMMLAGVARSMGTIDEKSQADR
jgi:hypothetical protein